VADRATLCFVIKAGQVLLIHKKRGLGAGKINGVGGKCELAEAAESCVKREAWEELRIAIFDLEPRAILRFQFTDGYSLSCTVFVATQFTGTPTETEEAKPFWCELEKIPFQEMWEDDRLWLGDVLQGRWLEGRFLFDGDKMLSSEIRALKEPIRETWDLGN
jgi:8-oxo-dGTP diphosphatase